MTRDKKLAIREESRQKEPGEWDDRWDNEREIGSILGLLQGRYYKVCNITET